MISTFGIFVFHDTFKKILQSKNFFLTKIKIKFYFYFNKRSKCPLPPPFILFPHRTPLHSPLMPPRPIIEFLLTDQNPHPNCKKKGDMKTLRKTTLTGLGVRVLLQRRG